MQLLDRERVVEWLLTHRVPLFLRSDLGLDMMLCVQLVQTPLFFTESSHDMSYGLLLDIARILDIKFNDFNAYTQKYYKRIIITFFEQSLALHTFFFFKLCLKK